MSMSPALAASPIARFTPEELAYMGDGIPRDAGGNALPWAEDLLRDMEREQNAKQATAARYVAEEGVRAMEPPAHPLTESFYAARPWTLHIMQRADYMGMAREGLLAATLAVMSSRIPANVKADLTGRDCPMPLNLYVNLTGVTGSGKSRAIATAKRLVGDDQHVLEINPASGEAIAAQYVERVKDGDIWVTQQKSDRALMCCTEVSQVTALAGRTGSTLIPQLLHAWSGETLGATTKTKELDMRVGAGLYRFSAIFGVQPANGGIFVSDGVTNGLAGRCLYYSTTDTTLADRIDTDMPAPTQQWPHMELPDGTTPITLTYPPKARAYALRLIREGTAGIVAETDGHRAENIARLAALYALADGRTAVNETDWGLAVTLMRRSDAVRAWLFARYADECVRSEAARVETKNTARDEAEERALTRVCNRLIRRLAKDTGGGMRRRELQRFLARDGRNLDAALNRLIDEKKIKYYLDTDLETPIYTLTEHDEKTERC